MEEEQSKYSTSDSPDLSVLTENNCVSNNPWFDQSNGVFRDESHFLRGGYNHAQHKRNLGLQGGLKAIMSDEEMRIQGELEMEVERDLEEEIKDGIYALALKLHRLYQHQKDAKMKTLSEVSVNIKMEGGTKIEFKEVMKKESPNRGKTSIRQEIGGGFANNSTKRFDWEKSLRSRGGGGGGGGSGSGGGGRVVAVLNKKNENSSHNGIRRIGERNGGGDLEKRKVITMAEKKLLELGWRG